MFILARDGKTYARLRFNVGPRGQTVIPVKVDFSRSFAGSSHEAWQLEYEANIQPEAFNLATPDPYQSDQLGWDGTPRLLDPTVEQEELELLARTQDMSPDELDDFFENEVMI